MRLGASAASQRDPAESAEITVAIEEARLCDGSVFGTAVQGQDGELELLSPALAYKSKPTLSFRMQERDRKL